MTPFTIESGSVVRPEDHAAWLDARMTGIGASEAAALLGVCPYTTPRDLYLRKLGFAPPFEETPAIRQGRHMEAFLAAEYRRMHPGAGLVEQVFLRHPEIPHLYATLDGRRADGVVVEFKTANSRQGAKWGADGSDEVPDAYLCQVQHQMLVAGAELAHVFASIGGDPPRLFEVRRNEAIVAAIVEAAGPFWRRVLERDPPPATGPADGKTNHLVFPEPAGRLALGDDGLALVAAWEAAKARRTQAEADCERTRTDLLEHLGQAEAGELPDGRTVTRKVQFRPGGTFERKDSTFTDLRIKARRRDG